MVGFPLLTVVCSVLVNFIGEILKTNILSTESKCRPGNSLARHSVRREQQYFLCVVLTMVLFNMLAATSSDLRAGLQGSLRKACISKDDSNLLTQSTILICKQGNGHGVCACPCNHLGVAQDRIAKTIKILHSELVPGHSTLKHKDWRYT